MAQESTSLDELFKRDPLELSDQQVDTITKALRKHHQDFAQEEANAKRQGRRSNPKRAAEKAASRKVNLDDLNLDLGDL